MRIAIIGTGISGLVAARELHPNHDLTIFEAAGHIGGHTNTVTVQRPHGHYAVDTGFIVFNDRTYPKFEKLLDELGVASQPADMSFSVKCARTGLEYNGTSLNRLFAQRRNLCRPSFWRMLGDIRRFNRSGKAFLTSGENDPNLSLGEFLERSRFSSELAEHYVLPMGAAIWSASRNAMLEFPLTFFLKFLDHHGLLSIDDRPQWRTVAGGSQTYVNALIKPFEDRIQIRCPIHLVTRNSDGVRLFPINGKPQAFDHVVFATHADQTLAMLEAPTELEREILSSFPYQENLAVLHTDTTILPKRQLAWACWNYHLLPDGTGKVAVTYNMNLLQRLKAPETFCVTLNDLDHIDPSKIIRSIVYHHPVFTPEGVANQGRFEEINGKNHSSFAGAYWFSGFHEDGVRSGQRVAARLREVAHA